MKFQNVVPYHHERSRGSKRFVVDAARQYQASIDQVSFAGIELTRRDAMKVGLVGAAAIGGVASTNRSAQANPVLWWIAKEVVVAAAGWLISRVVTRVLENTVGRKVNAIVDDLTAAASYSMEVVEVPAPLAKIRLYEFHYQKSWDGLQFDAKAIFAEQEVKGYGCGFGVNRLIQPIDPRADLITINQIEAGKGFHQSNPILSVGHRQPFADNLSASWKKAYKQAQKEYDLDMEIRQSDIAWCQSERDIDGRLVHAFGLKPDVAKAAKIPVFLT